MSIINIIYKRNKVKIKMTSVQSNANLEYKNESVYALSEARVEI